MSDEKNIYEKKNYIYHEKKFMMNFLDVKKKGVFFFINNLDNWKKYI